MSTRAGIDRCGRQRPRGAASLLCVMVVLAAAALSGAQAQTRKPAGQIARGGRVIALHASPKTFHVQGQLAAQGGLEPKFFEPEDRDEHKIPPTPKGRFIGDPRPSKALTVQVPGRAGVEASTDNIAFAKNVALGAAGHNNFGSSTGEPSVATSGNTVFYTGNWYASLSTNGGTSFQYIDPFSFFGNSPNNLDFCCDQVVHYAPQVDLFFWLLQYIEDANNNNAYRIAYGTTQQIANNQWRVADLTSQGVGLDGVFMDFPDLAVSNNNLYLTFNAFGTQNALGTVVLRAPLAGFVADNAQFNGTLDQGHFNFRLAQNCTDVQYYATHESTSSLRVWSWPESSQSATSAVVNHASYSIADNTSTTPDGFDWLGKEDDRLTAGTKAGNELWFGWGAGRGGASNRPQPYIEIVRINSTNNSLISQPALWTDQYAYAYPAFGTNSNNEVGIAYAYGGNGQMVHHAVGILTGTQKLVQSVAGLHGPESNRWGDYFTIRPHTANKKLFAATGFTLQAGTGRQQGDPRFFIFGRSTDVNGGGGATITVNSPNGGENWTLNSQHTILWSSSNVSGNVKIELSRDGGGSYETLFASTANDGSEDWTVAGATSTNCLVRISQASSAAVNDVSNAAFTISAGGNPLATPSGLDVQAISDTALTVTWTDNATGEDGYKIESKVQGGNYVQIGTLPADAELANVDSATPNTTYYFRVRCYKGSQNSAYSNEDFDTTEASSLAAPSALLAKALKKKKIKLSWLDNSEGEEGFAVEVDDGTGFREIGVVSANSTGAIVTRLRPNKFYNFRVRAKLGNSYSEYSNTAGAKAKK